MKIKLVLLCSIAMNFVIGCKAPDITNPANRMGRMMVAMRQGQTCEWDETVIDTVTPSSTLSDSSADFRAFCINRQIKKWHVIVSIPDSTVPQFQITRAVTQYAQRDTMGGIRISKEVIYGSQYTTYDSSGNLVSSITLNSGPGDSAQDFTEFSFFEYRPDTVVNDSMRTKFADTMSAQGYTVTNLGSSGYKIEGTFHESGKSWSVTSYLDHDYLTVTHSDATSSEGVTTSEEYTYSSISGYKINTSRITTTSSTMPNTWQAAFSNLSPVYNISPVFTSSQVQTLQLSNISLP